LLEYGSSVVMGHYLIVLVSEFKGGQQPLSGGSYGCFAPPTDHHSTISFAIDFRDNSVQEVTKNKQLLCSQEDILLKCNDKQILILRGSITNNELYLLTIESFERKVYSTFQSLTLYKAFKWDYEIVHTQDLRPNLMHETAQIYNEFLYVSGQCLFGLGFSERELWTLNLSKKTLSFYFLTLKEDLTWELCETYGEPPGLMKTPSSFIIQDNLYLFGGSQKDIFELNLGKSLQKINNPMGIDSMNWTKLEQDVDYFDKVQMIKGGGIYKDHFITLGHCQKDYSFEDYVLYCWNPSIPSSVPLINLH